MTSRFSTTLAYIALASIPAFAQTVAKAAIVRHLQTSRDFTLQVAEQMPEADYGFKLTPPQMSFAEQMAHLAEDQAGILAPLSKGNSNPGRPASMSKKDVIAYVRQTFDKTIDTVSNLTPEQLSQTYNRGGGSSMTGVELVMFVMDHTTHHRASAEMYLRAKGITPAEYQF